MCHMLPRNKPELVVMTIGAAVLVILIFIIFEILSAPLVIVDARSDLEDPSEVAAKRIFTISVQGPIASLPKSVSRLVHQRVRYRTSGTGLQWLDFDPQKSSKAIKVRATDRRKRLLLQDAYVPFDCASCRGSMKAADVCFLFTLLIAFISLVAVLPAIVKVTVMSGNGFEHTFAACVCRVKTVEYRRIVLVGTFVATGCKRLCFEQVWKQHEATDICRQGHRCCICHSSNGGCGCSVAPAGGVVYSAPVSSNCILRGFG